MQETCLYKIGFEHFVLLEGVRVEERSLEIAKQVLGCTNNKKNVKQELWWTRSQIAIANEMCPQSQCLRLLFWLNDSQQRKLCSPEIQYQVRSHDILAYKVCTVPICYDVQAYDLSLASLDRVKEISAGSERYYPSCGFAGCPNLILWGTCGLRKLVLHTTNVLVISSLAFLLTSKWRCIRFCYKLPEDRPLFFRTIVLEVVLPWRCG